MHSYPVDQLGQWKENFALIVIILNMKHTPFLTSKQKAL